MNKIGFGKQLLVLVTVVVALLVLGACSSKSSTTTPAPTTTPPPTTTLAPTTTQPPTTTQAYTVITASKTGIGNYLVDGKGMTLYYFTKDAPGKSNATANVIANWPIFYAANVAIPASLNTSDFGSITGFNGAPQSTYRGWPLYYYVKDKTAGDTLGQGVGGIWFVIDPANFPPIATTPLTTTPPTTTPPPTTTTPPPTTTAASVTVNLIAKNLAFDKSTITVPAGATVILNFDNQDSGIPHNFSLYTNSSASPPALFQGQIINGPAQITYTFTAPTTPGTYFFRCDVHPTMMTGSFIVQ